MDSECFEDLIADAVALEGAGYEVKCGVGTKGCYSSVVRSRHKPQL